MNSIHAIYENGIFRPVDPVDLPEHCHVEFEPKVIDGKLPGSSLDEVYDILSERFESGEADVASRHDEHQP